MSARKLTFLTLILLFIVLSFCNKDNPNKNAVAATLYAYTGLDGCSWVVNIEDINNICEISGFPDTGFNMQDGKKVWITYKPAESQASICMIGPMIEITGIWER